MTHSSQGTRARFSGNAQRKALCTGDRAARLRGRVQPRMLQHHLRPHARAGALQRAAAGRARGRGARARGGGRRDAVAHLPQRRVARRARKRPLQHLRDAHTRSTTDSLQLLSEGRRPFRCRGP